MTLGTIVSLNVSDGGVPKRPVEEAWVSPAGMAGDRQADRRHHGGTDRALCLYSADLIDGLRREGHPITAGAAGENVTIAGLDWELVRPGLLLQLGRVEVEVTTYTVPCRTIRGAFLDQRFGRISQRVHPGWSRVYARVLKEGLVQVGMRVTRLGR